MRSSKSRSRNKPNRNRSVGNIVNRVFDSSGPEGKVRGTPQQIIEKYQQLHRDAQLSGDRVSAENFQQHAEHYARMLAEALKEQEARREAQEAQQAQQRERQQREREERAEKQQQQQAEGGNGQPAEAGDANAEKRRARPKKSGGDGDREGLERALGAVEGSDVIDLGSGNEDAGLVETVEQAAKPARKPRARKPKAAPEAPSSDDQTAAE